MEPDKIVAEKIFEVNRKIVPFALLGAVPIGIGMGLLNPFSNGNGMDPFFGLISAIIAFKIIYNLLFRTIGSDVFEAAKKQSKCLLTDDADFFDESMHRRNRDECFDAMHKNLSWNIHHNH